MGNSISISCIFRLSFDLLFLKNFQSHHSGPKGRCSGMTRSFYLHSVSDPDSDQTSISRQCCCFNQVPICHRNCHLQIIKTAFCHFLHLLTKRLCSNQKLSRCNRGIEKAIPIPGTAFLMDCFRIIVSQAGIRFLLPPFAGTCPRAVPLQSRSPFPS